MLELEIFDIIINEITNTNILFITLIELIIVAIFHALFSE
jgi:hypothetical protein